VLGVWTTGTVVIDPLVDADVELGATADVFVVTVVDDVDDVKDNDNGIGEPVELFVPATSALLVNVECVEVDVDDEVIVVDTVEVDDKRVLPVDTDDDIRGSSAAEEVGIVDDGVNIVDVVDCDGLVVVDVEDVDILVDDRTVKGAVEVSGVDDGDEDAKLVDVDDGAELLVAVTTTRLVGELVDVDEGCTSAA